MFSASPDAVSIRLAEFLSGPSRFLRMIKNPDRKARVEKILSARKCNLSHQLALLMHFPKVTFMKKLLLSAMFFGVFSMLQVHAANVMEGIFKGMVASTAPASVRTASRVGAVGGSYSYRQPQVNTNLVNVSFPKASVGCNGIDIFLGSFSMINGFDLLPENSTRLN